MQNPITKNTSELNSVVDKATPSMRINCCGSKSNPSRYNKKMIPMVDISDINIGSFTSAIPEGPRIIPSKI